MVRDYTYAELCRMKKSRVIRLAGYPNLKQLIKDHENVDIKDIPTTKKQIARAIASDR